MAARGQAMTVEFHAWDTSANAPKTGDAANITLRWVKDGTSAALTTTTVTEVDATNAPGVYKCSLSATETDGLAGKLAGKSATANIVIFGPSIFFDDPGAVWDVSRASHTTTGTFGGDAVDAPPNFDALAIDASGNLTGSVGSLSNTGVDALFTRALTEAYSTKGGTVTVAQALYEILSILQEKGVSGTTVTANKRDGSTAAQTFTLDDATSPTSITRAT